MMTINPARWQLFTDGASRNNPGLAGAGIYLLQEQTPIVKQGFFLGIKTNNQAEYLALLLGLYFAKRHMKSQDILIISSDSQLIVRQLSGEYAVKHPDLQPLYARIQERLLHIEYEIRHIMRKDNSVADQLANNGIDKRLPIPQEFADLI